MFETFLLRVYYLNDLNEVDCKTCLLMLMQSRDNDKMLQFRVQCSIYNHEHDALLKWNVWLQWWCNMRMRDPMHDQNDAYATMQLPWCWPNDVYTMMQGWWYLQCMHTWNAWSMMHTLKSWWRTWFTLYNRSFVTNTWVGLYPWARIKS
jgi:hypothetical protein